MSTIIPKAIIIDLDGTLCDHTHRLHHIIPNMTHGFDTLYNKQGFYTHYRTSEGCSESNQISWIHKFTGEKWVSDWPAFYAAMGEDKCNEWCEQLLSGWLLDGGGEVIFITGRPEKYRNITTNWLMEIYCIRHMGHSDDLKLFMRPDFQIKLAGFTVNPLDPACDRMIPDHRPSHEVKREIYMREISGKYDVLFAIDDDDRVCEMWKELGITTLKVM